MNATVSTIIPAYNAERTITEAVDSALAQDYERHEVIVVNDGSTDSTARLLEAYGSRIRVIHQRNTGVSAARNAGVMLSSGKYIALLDSDDIWLPGKLTRLIAALVRNPGASLAFSEYGFIDGEGRELHTSSIGALPSFNSLMDELPFPVVSMKEGLMPSTWVLPRTSFDRVGGFCETFKGAGFEDSWILVLLRELGAFAYIPDKLALYRPDQSIEMADKYGAGADVFVSLVKARYGPRGRSLIRNTRNVKCRWLLSKLAHQMDRGNHAGALLSLAEIARVSPSYFVTWEFLGRVRLPQNTKRIRELMIAASRR